MKILSRVVLGACLAVFAGFPAAFAAQGDEAIEEVVVTGSYLKRSAEDSPSPLSVITAANIEDLGASDISEVVQAMPWSSGSQTRAATFQGEGADGRNSINLRNLGHGATLPLVNGKRTVASWYNGRGNASVNVNGLIPNIALERLEIIKDGASALYGSDAIAGVVNFITKKDFEGFDASYQYTVDERSRNGEANQMGMIWGVQGDRGGIVASISFLNRDEINVGDDFSRYGGTAVSLTGQPGRLVPIKGEIPVWAANGVDPGNPVAGGALPRRADGSSFGQADVNCEDSAKVEEGATLGPLFGNTYCVYDFGSHFAIQAEESLRKMHVDGHYDLTDNFEAYFSFSANDSEFDRPNSSNPNAPALTIPVSVSYVDAGGAVASSLNPGSVEDAYRRGIEPIRYANLTRLIGGRSDSPFDRRPVETYTKAHRADQRTVVGGTWDFDLGDKEWSIDASYTASQHNTAQTEVQDTQSSHMELALSGMGGPNCDHVNGTPGEGNATYAATGSFVDGGCYFFNPFGNSQFDRDGNTQTDLNLVNPAELYIWLQGRVTYDLAFKQRVIDVVASGDLFETNAGPIGLAIGFQRRRDSGSADFDSAVNANNLDFAYGAQDWGGALTTTAVFGELAVPIGERFEVNVAVRYEDFDEIGVDTTDPKITLLWRPIDSLSLRASAGTSFRVPSLQQLFGSITTVANEVDVVGGTAFKPAISVGNRELKPESADNWNIGFSWVPQDGFLEGFQIDVDYYDYDYTDVITRESPSTLLAADNAALVAYVAANPGSDFVDAVNAGVGNPEQIIRNSQAVFIRSVPRFANANSAQVSGMDVTTSYSFDTGFGDWRVGLQAAWIEEYTVTTSDGRTLDAVGNYNSTNPVARPMPEWKVNGTLNWSLGSHRAFMIVKYVDEIESDISAGTRGFYAATTTLAGNGHLAADLRDTKIESFTTVDLQYSYNFGETGFLNDTNIALGVQNVFDEDAPVMAVTTAFDGGLHDGRGRIWFLRVGASM